MSCSETLQKYMPNLGSVKLAKVDIIYDMLVAKNAVMNLTALTDEKGVALLHFYDSLSLFETGLFKSGSVIDIGCGGGFPSIPIALFSTGCKVTANDATAKKLEFVRDVAISAGIGNLSTLPGRAEELGVNPAYRNKFDVAVARGVARLNILCEWCMPFVREGGNFVAMKGEKGAEEAAEAANAIKTLGGEIVDIINVLIPVYDYRHTLVVIKKTHPTPAQYPRRNGAIMKKPL